MSWVLAFKTFFFPAMRWSVGAAWVMHMVCGISAHRTPFFSKKKKCPVATFFCFCSCAELGFRRAHCSRKPLGTVFRVCLSCLVVRLGFWWVGFRAVDMMSNAAGAGHAYRLRNLCTGSEYILRQLFVLCVLEGIFSRSVG